MAEDLWNRVNIPRPGAVCTVRVPFTHITGSRLKRVLDKNDTVLCLLRSELLQTDIRVLYELLYVLNNSLKSNQTLRGLKRVEQCINKLKNMKLVEALQEVQEFFPKNIQRKLSIEAGEGDVPSQPLLEWLCLKVLGGAQLMSYTLQRCITAFTLSRQQMMWSEFLVLNMVITSMLSRLWTIFQGILVSLSALYQPLLRLLSEVSSAQPMPFLTDFSLPKDMIQFLGLSDTFLITKLEACHSQSKPTQRIQERKKNKQRKKKKKQVDLGVAIQRAWHTNQKQSQKVLQDSTKVSKAKPVLHQRYACNKERVLKTQMTKAATFTELVPRLDETIAWCQKEQMTKQIEFLSRLHRQCRNMKKLEERGHNLYTKLKILKQQACGVFSPHWTAPKSPVPRKAVARSKTNFNSLKNQLRRHLTKDCKRMQLKKQKKQQKGQRKGLQPSGRSKKRSKAKTKTSNPSSRNDDHDDIDDIFASAGL